MKGKHSRLRSFRCFSFQVFQRRGGDTEFVWQLHSDPGTEEPENGIVVDSVSDAEHDFPSQVRPDCFRLGFPVGNAVRHGALTLKNFARKASELVDEALGDETCTRHRALHLRVPTPLIAVALSSANAFRQTEKMIENVSIVSSGRRRRFSA